MPNSVAYQRDQVINIINSVLGRVKAPDALPKDVIGRELQELKELIEGLRQDLHAARASDITDHHIPSAADELDAVVLSTEQATGTILDSCDANLNIAKEGDAALAERIEQHIVKVYEACTFQDIVGQRVKKVTTSLKEVDGKIKSILSVIDGNYGLPENEQTPLSADPLLNGPALPADSVSQDEIDRLLAEFDQNNKKEVQLWKNSSQSF